MDDYLLGKKLNEKLKFVYSYLIKMGATKEDAEDTIQETAYKFLRKRQIIPTFQVDGDLVMI